MAKAKLGMIAKFIAKIKSFVLRAWDTIKSWF